MKHRPKAGAALQRGTLKRVPWELIRMKETPLEFLTAQVELSEQLLAGRETIFDPQDLPG